VRRKQGSNCRSFGGYASQLFIGVSIQQRNGRHMHRQKKKKKGQEYEPAFVQKQTLMHLDSFQKQTWANYFSNYITT